MGSVKKHWEALNELNLSSVPEKNVCDRHFRDSGIKQFIRSNRDNGFCDYCQRDLMVVSLEDLMEFLMISIGTFYQDAANFMSFNSREGGYLGETYTVNELLQEIELEAEPHELFEDISNSIDEIAWARPDQYEESNRDILIYQWKYFKESVKYKSRYLFIPEDNNEYSSVYSILEEVGELIQSLKLVRKISKTEFYRIRQHNNPDGLIDMKELVSPPRECALCPNRFSPTGISMLYAAFEKDTAWLETINERDEHKQFYTIAKLTSKSDLYVIDFGRLPKIPSIYGLKSKKKYYLICFIHDLISDFTKPIEKDGKEHIEYVPTQIVTEFFRFPFNASKKLKIEGIVYPSSKNNSGLSSVFFWDNKECIKNLRLVDLEHGIIRKPNSEALF